MDKKQIEKKDSPETAKSRMYKLFGFELNDLKTWRDFVILMNRPEDPSCLAIFRILFGIVMMIDIPHERGMSAADVEFTSNDCIFPLFHSLKPLAPQWMLVLYTIMFFGALGICIGFKYRFSCLCFVLPYWYFFFLDKTTWNNHSYLYGLMGIQFLLIDANRFLSVDALMNKNIRNAHIPLWNYTMLRIQIFLVYFIAGVKKLDPDWVFGYSMESLGAHWVFTPFRAFLTNDQITLYIVHGGGLFLDLFVGYFLFFDKTRLLGTIMSSMFHLMNSRMFSIGMFPYTMLATTTVFYSVDWPKRLVNYYTNSKYSEKMKIKNLSSHCIYVKDDIKADDEKKDKKLQTRTTTNISLYHKFFTVYLLCYVSEQLILPYSHSLTKGYNNWTNGLYGYSWDMMIHSWHTQHIKIAFKDKNTNKTHYLNPKAWTTARRWSSHADMIYQYGKCIEERLAKSNYTNIELYIDIWRSMNHRFNQRQIDPRVDLTKAKWSPFEQTTWLMPLMTNLNNWREKMKSIEKDMGKINRDLDVTFVADLPGLMLENFISNDLNTTIEVLNGRINVEIGSKNHTMNVGDKMRLPSGKYHNVHTISDEPSCYLYIFLNQTSYFHTRLYDVYFENMFRLYNKVYEELKVKEPLKPYDNLTYAAFELTVQNHTDNLFLQNLTNKTSETNANYNVESVILTLNERKENVTKLKVYYLKTLYYAIRDHMYHDKISMFTKTYIRLQSYIHTFKRSFTLSYLAFKSLILNRDFMDVLEQEFYEKIKKKQ